MVLADDIRALEQQTLAALDAGHDYYVDTKRAWRVLQQNANAGQQLRVIDPDTGTILDDGDRLLRRSQGYVTEYLAPSTFLHFVSLFEHYVLELMRHWRIAYPRPLEARSIEFKEVLDANDKAEIISSMVDKSLRDDLSNSGIDIWFEKLNNMVELGCPTGDEVQALVEIKATRNVVVHNKGIADETYIQKAGDCARANVGERLMFSERYHRESWDTIQKVVRDVSIAAITKAQ